MTSQNAAYHGYEIENYKGQRPLLKLIRRVILRRIPLIIVQPKKLVKELLISEINEIKMIGMIHAIIDRGLESKTM